MLKTQECAPPYTFCVRGKYWYYRRPGGFRRALGTNPQSDAFQNAYAIAEREFALLKPARIAVEAQRAEWRERALKSRLTRADADTQGTVYAIGGSYGAIKLGFTTDLPKRFDRLQMSGPIKLRVLLAFEGTPRDELALHRRFATDRLHGEWFKRSPDLLACIAQISALSGEEQREALLYAVDPE